MTSAERTIAITGAAGALGRYAVLYFRHKCNFQVVEIDRKTFGSPAQLRDLLCKAEAIIHLAGVNRAPHDDLQSVNPGIARTLVSTLEAIGTTPHVIYASTIHESGDNAYGQSKRAAGDIIGNWAGRTGAKFSRLKLPHIYSELVRPFYNSGIATFCNQVATGKQPEIDVDATITPLHAFKVCELIGILLDGREVDLSPRGPEAKMSEILSDIQQLHATYMSNGIIPDLRQNDRLFLFNTYRSHLYPSAFPIYPELHTDARGRLFEATKSLNGGQSFISTTKPGVTRGNHFHFNKVERFCVLQGEARIMMRQMGSSAVVSFDVTSDRPCFVDMPTLWAHNICNTGGSELITLFWTHEIFDPVAPDTFASEV